MIRGVFCLSGGAITVCGSSPQAVRSLGKAFLSVSKREVKEETGLDVVTAFPMAIYSNLDVVTAFGEKMQLFQVQFLVNEWRGELLSETDETIDARFFSPDKFPTDIHPMYQEVLDDLRGYDRTLILK